MGEGVSTKVAESTRSGLHSAPHFDRGLDVIRSILNGHGRIPHEFDKGRVLADLFEVGVLVNSLPVAETVLESAPEVAHRSFRVTDDEKRKKWLLDGLKKVERLSFLTQNTGRTLGQAAIKYILAEPSVASVLPNIYNEQQLREFAAASDASTLTPAELATLGELHARNYGLAPVA